MSNELLTVLSFILIIIGIIGTVLPVLPGLIVSYAGLLVLKFTTDIDMPESYIWLFGGITLVSLILEYLIPAKLAKKYGGTRWGSIGSFLGTLIGLFFIPVAFGFLIGMLLGAFIGELLHDAADKKKAFNAAKGAFIGFLMGTGFNFISGMAMFLIGIYYLIF